LIKTICISLGFNFGIHVRQNPSNGIVPVLGTYGVGPRALCHSAYE